MLSETIRVVRCACAMLCALVALALTAPGHAQCPGDITGDGLLVNGEDLSLVLAAWASDGTDVPGSDVNQDGIVNGADLAFVLGAWGPCVTTPAWATLIEAFPDPAVVTDPAIYAAITATGLAWRVKDTATQIEFVLIPPGSFWMGCSASWAYNCDTWENPLHTVTLTDAFYMGRYEVTQAQWTAQMGSNPSYFQSESTQVPAAQVPNRPVEQVSWNTIQGFLTQTGMRLPTEAEWEYAYRAQMKIWSDAGPYVPTAFHGFTSYPDGTDDDSLLGNIAWFYGGSCSNGAQCQTLPVGGKLGNHYGLHDMAGNVWEWVNDWYSSSYYSSSPKTNPPGPTTGSKRVVRGGCWADDSFYCRSSERDFYTPTLAWDCLGFRVARNP